MDKDNYLALNTWVQGQGSEISEKITTYNAGVWNENGTLSYGRMASSDSFSIFNPMETVTAETVRLDDVLGDKRITLLKMDIEGAERHKTRRGIKVWSKENRQEENLLAGTRYFENSKSGI